MDGDGDAGVAARGAGVAGADGVDDAAVVLEGEDDLGAARVVVVALGVAGGAGDGEEVLVLVVLFWGRTGHMGRMERARARDQGARDRLPRGCAEWPLLVTLGNSAETIPERKYARFQDFQANSQFCNFVRRIGAEDGHEGFGGDEPTGTSASATDLAEEAPTVVVVEGADAPAEGADGGARELGGLGEREPAV